MEWRGECWKAWAGGKGVLRKHMLVVMEGDATGGMEEYLLPH